jgi:hypothetical protein
MLEFSAHKKRNLQVRDRYRDGVRVRVRRRVKNKNKNRKIKFLSSDNFIIFYYFRWCISYLELWKLTFELVAEKFRYFEKGLTGLWSERRLILHRHP